MSQISADAKRLHCAYVLGVPLGVMRRPVVVARRMLGWDDDRILEAKRELYRAHLLCKSKTYPGCIRIIPMAHRRQDSRYAA